MERTTLKQLAHLAGLIAKELGEPVEIEEGSATYGRRWRARVHGKCIAQGRTANELWFALECGSEVAFAMSRKVSA